jgi:amino acid permease
MGVIGGLGSTMLAFTAPALIHLRVFKETITSRERMFNYFLVVFGIVGGFASAVVGISSIIELSRS